VLVIPPPLRAGDLVAVIAPSGPLPLDAFWRNRGFSPYPDLTCTMKWKQVDSAERVENQLSFWLKSLRGAPLP